MSSPQPPQDSARSEDAPPNSNSPPSATDDTNASTTVPGPTPSSSRGSVSSFIFASIMLFMLMNGGDDLVTQSHYRDSLRSLRWQQTNFTDWLHGLEAPNFTMPKPDVQVAELARGAMTFGRPLHPETSSYYSNITGFVHGPTEMYNLTTSNFTSDGSFPGIPWARYASPMVREMNMTDAIERMGTWNWSRKAEIAFRVLEKRPSYTGEGIVVFNDTDQVQLEDISVMHGRVEITDAENGNELGFDMEAVHFTTNGTIYGFAEPDGKHVDLRSLPSLVPAYFMNVTAQAVNAELVARIKRLEDMIDSGVLEFDSSSTEETPQTTCPFTLFLQLTPTSVPLHLMTELESELESPTGISTVARPNLTVNGILISRECGIVFEVKEAEGLKSQRFWRKVTTYASLACVAYLGLLWLLLRQMAISQTPVGISRVSRWTFLTQAATDSVSFVGHLTFGILADGRPSLSLIAPAFLASVLLVHEARFSVLIHQIQAPEETAPPPTRPRPQTSTTEATADGTNSGAASPTPTNDASSTSSPGLISRLWQRLRESPQGRLIASLALALMIFIQVLVSPSLGVWIVAVVYSSFWIPQIVRSARRDTASGLSAQYLLGTTFFRLFFALYLFGCPNNVLGVDPSPWIYWLSGVVIFQVFILILQEKIGPSFFLPKSYVHAQRYNYHPVFPDADAEAPSQESLGDCAICLDAIKLQPSSQDIISSSSSSLSSRDHPSRPGTPYNDHLHLGSTGLWHRLRSTVFDSVRDARSRALRTSKANSAANARNVYALAPCGHLFHTACLEKWLAIKNICPQCRRPLPPL